MGCTHSGLCVVSPRATILAASFGWAFRILSACSAFAVSCLGAGGPRASNSFLALADTFASMRVKSGRSSGERAASEAPRCHWRAT